MTDINGTISYKGKDYRFVFTLNVMEAIQKKYGTLDKWAELTDGAGGESNAEAVIFGFREMLNEGIDIENEETGGNTPFLTLKQVGRLITEVGLANASKKLNDTVVQSTRNEEKN